MNHRRVTIKNQFRELAYYQNRMLVGFFVIVCLMIVLILWVMNLQVVHYDKYRNQSDANRIRVLPIAPTRGLIFDRNGVVLAENKAVYSLELIPEKVADIASVIDELKHIVSLDEDDISRFWKELRRTRARFKKIPVKQKLTEKERALFGVNRHKFPGVGIEARLVRYYPYGETLVHTIGYVGRINDRELREIDPQKYQATRHIGKVGIEKFYESILHGDIGSQEVITDVQGRVIEKLHEISPKAGADLYLSIDLSLQQKAAEAIGDKRGAIIAVDPRDGSVLALVSNPGYNPNSFVTGISSKEYKSLLESSDRPLFNRALRGQYSPGSTIKPHLAWLGLMKGVITPDYSVVDSGIYYLPNDDTRKYRDWNWDEGGHGKTNYRKAIAKSCDVFFYELAYKLGIDAIHESMSLFGFGEYTGIDMGEEVPGLMPSRAWKKGARGVHWFPGETVIIGIGQGYWTTTPLQLANATATIANNGLRYQLRLVKGVGREGSTVSVAPILADNQIDIGDGLHFKRIQEAMKEVNRGGTGKAAFMGAKYSSAGKSGTAQVTGYAQDEKYEVEKVAEKLRDNALFISYAPYENPTIAVAVILENAGGGSTNAAPVAREIMDLFLDTSVGSEKVKP